MINPRSTVSIVSGYFGPLHVGHLDMFEEARARSGYLFVIVNNDRQQELKKGRVIQSAEDRLRIVQALGVVDTAMISVDLDNSVAASLSVARVLYPYAELEFCQGGDRRGLDDLPAIEAASVERNRITVVYGVGGDTKADSSTRLLAALEGS